MARKIAMKVNRKAVFKKMLGIRKNAPVWAAAANYEHARRVLYHRSVNVYAPHSGRNNYGQKRWGERLTDSASIRPLGPEGMLGAMVEFTAPQSALLHELPPGPSRYVTRPGSKPKFLKTALQEASSIYISSVKKLFYLYMNTGAYPRPKEHLRGEGGL